MTHPFNFPPIVEAITPQAGAAITGDYISLKNVHKLRVVVHINQANAAQVAITIEQATAVAGTGHVPITVAVPIYVCESAAASDAFVREAADAVAYTTTVGTTHKIVVFEIDPATLNVAGGFDCITVITAASNAGNITSAFYELVQRYQQATPPSAILD